MVATCPAQRVELAQCISTGLHAHEGSQTNTRALAPFSLALQACKQATWHFTRRSLHFFVYQSFQSKKKPINAITCTTLNYMYTVLGKYSIQYAFISGLSQLNKTSSNKKVTQHDTLIPPT